MHTLPDAWLAIQEALLPIFQEEGLWGEGEAADPLPTKLTRGSDEHLAFLTLVYTISGGRKPGQLWEAARKTWNEDPALFDPHGLAFAKPRELEPRLKSQGLTRKTKSEATVWQRIGKALFMRAGGSVHRLLADHGHDAQRLLAMLEKSRTTFPVLSGPQTAPRWIYGLARFGERSITNLDTLAAPVSPACARALDRLGLTADELPIAIFDAMDALGRQGCQQHQASMPICPVAAQCAVTHLCPYGNSSP